jgi:hypothetical protein
MTGLKATTWQKLPFLARHSSLQNKFLLPKLVSSQGHCSMFLEEAMHGELLIFRCTVLTAVTQDKNVNKIAHVENPRRLLRSVSSVFGQTCP